MRTGLYRGAKDPLDQLAGRVAHQHGAKPAAAIACYRRHLSDVEERRPHLAVHQLERNAGQKDAIEEAFQDRRIAVVPHRIAEHQRFGLSRRLT